MSSSEIDKEESPKTDGTGLPPLGNSLAGRIFLAFSGTVLILATIYAGMIAWKLRPHEITSPREALDAGRMIAQWHFGSSGLLYKTISVRDSADMWIIGGSTADGAKWHVDIERKSGRVVTVIRR